MISQSNKPSLLIAFGGNALNVPGHSPAHQKEEFLIAQKSFEQIIPLIKSNYSKIVLTHGNGPQVGQIFLQQELTANEFPRKITLDICVADSQGRIGYILQNVFDNACLQNGINKRSFSVITQVRVDANDPAFQNPSKPIGVFYSKREADQLAQDRGWIIKEDSGRGFRRVVPSPKPLEIIEKEIFTHLLKKGFIVIGAGGGGIPVIRNENGTLEGVEAVIDKDLTSALLANTIGIEYLVILTQVEFAYLDFHSPHKKPILKATTKEIAQWLEEGHFSEGSMKPKVQAALEFLRNGGKRAIIAHLDHLFEAIEGKKGTQIFS